MSKLQDEHLEFFFETSVDLMGIAGVDGYFKRVNVWDRVGKEIRPGGGP